MRTGQQLEAFSTMLGVVASVAVHLAALAYIATISAQFDFDFELTLPAEVEFGLTGEMEMAAAPAPPRATGATDPRWSGEPNQEGEHPTTDAGVPLDPDTDADTDTDTDADPDTEPDPPPVAAPTLSGPSRIPPGAQLALRVDMKRVRESALAPDVTSFLQGVPDWQLLLEGSGIDPVEDLDRLLVATPNLQRSKLVLAGRHRRDASFARRSVKRLARSRGKGVRWRQRYGVATAPWYNLDRTPRTIALLSAHHFSIMRRQDLQRILAMTKARELRDAKKEGLVAARGPDALLSMGPEEAISLEVEGVHRFIIGNIKHVPVRLRLAIRETGPDEATVSVLATYASEDDARGASVYWKKVAEFYSQQLIMTIAGFGKTLRRMEFAPDEDRIQVSFTLSADQIRFILSYAEGRLRGAASTRRQPTKKGP
ncbi:MAG: hypothetical protein JRE45_01890 [Deltaproteobacteria bacterium]|nr:hypothetical protein [Deltaproteobacteria bacterium]